MSTKDVLLNCLNEMVPNYRPDQDFRSQVDSLSLVSIVIRVEAELGVQFSPFEISDIFSGTLYSIIDNIKTRYPLPMVD